MARKKKDMETTQSGPSVTETEAVVGKEASKQVAEKRPPQMVTVNGDKITHAHVFKSNQSDDWFYTAKINDVPLKPQKVSPEDLEAVLNKVIKPVDLMPKYYPSKLAPKVNEADFKLPMTLSTPEGEKTVFKFNVYKEKNMESYDYGKYRFYAQVNDMKMSAPASKQDLDAYFDRTSSPKDIITRVFGEKLHLAEHYNQFRLPEGVEDKNIRLTRNQLTNRYEISAIVGDSKTPAKEISYDDRQSFFTHKTATKEQLAAKYLNNEITTALQAIPAKEMVKQPTLSM